MLYLGVGGEGQMFLAPSQHVLAIHVCKERKGVLRGAAISGSNCDPVLRAGVAPVGAHHWVGILSSSRMSLVRWPLGPAGSQPARTAATRLLWGRPCFRGGSCSR